MAYHQFVRKCVYLYQIHSTQNVSFLLIVYLGTRASSILGVQRRREIT